MSIQPGVGYTFTSSGQGTNLNIERPWSEFDPVASTDHPFKVRAVFGSNATDLRVYVTAGTVNNIVPTIYGGDENSPLLNAVPQPYSVIPGGAFTTYDIYLKLGYDSTTNSFPSATRIPAAKYPQIDYRPEESPPTGDPADTDDFAYIKLGRIVVNNATLSVTSTIQYVTGSLWTDRIKVGSLTAKYYYSRI
jgi:hypothetical protein